MGLNTANEEFTDHERRRNGTRVVSTFLINKSPEELYRFWHNFANLPTFMEPLQSVQVIDEKRSHWVTRAPSIAGGKVEWDAQITRDDPNTCIEWQSLPGSDVINSGAVRFEKAPGDRGTMVHVTLDYQPPAGQLGRWVAKLFGEVPERQIKEDLRNFKRLMETGEIITTIGQPRGTCLGAGKRQRAK